MLVMVPSKNSFQGPYEPKVVGLAELIQHYIDQQIEVVTKRLQFHLRNVYLVVPNTQELAMSVGVDSVVSNSYCDRSCVQSLIGEFSITKEMAEAVLIHNLGGQKLEACHADAQNSLKAYGSATEAVADYQHQIKNRSQVLQIVKNQITELRDKHADARRTKVICEEKT